MSIVPLLVNLLESEYRDLDHDFGIHPLDIFVPMRTSQHLMMPRRRFSPYSVERTGRTGRADSDLLVTIPPTVGKDGFQVSMDVAQFKPSELSVKVVDNFIVVEGKHDERTDDHGLIQRHFVRKYSLPKNYDSKEVMSTISSDGVLTVKAPPPAKDKRNERIVQIQHTGPTHLSVKAPAQETNKVKNGAPETMETSK